MVTVLGLRSTSMPAARQLVQRLTILLERRIHGRYLLIATPQMRHSLSKLSVSTMKRPLGRLPPSASSVSVASQHKGTSYPLSASSTYWENLVASPNTVGRTPVAKWIQATGVSRFGRIKQAFGSLQCDRLELMTTGLIKHQDAPSTATASSTATTHRPRTFPLSQYRRRSQPLRARISASMIRPRPTLSSNINAAAARFAWCCRDNCGEETLRPC